MFNPLSVLLLGRISVVLFEMKRLAPVCYANSMEHTRRGLSYRRSADGSKLQT